MINTPKRAFNAGRDWQKQGRPDHLHPKMRSELIEHFRRGWYMQSKIADMVVPSSVETLEIKKCEAPNNRQRLAVFITVPNRKTINALSTDFDLSIDDVVNYALELLMPFTAVGDRKGCVE